MRQIVLGVALLPVALVAWVVRPVVRQLDSSAAVGRHLQSLSASLAAKRGLLLVAGTALLLVSLLAHVVVFVALVVTDTVGQPVLWLCIPVALLHAGVITGFVGVMLATPLGPGYRQR